jgi:hypothetical protein
VAHVQRLDRGWKPSPSMYQTPEGLIQSYRADAAQARARASELAEVLDLVHSQARRFRRVGLATISVPKSGASSIELVPKQVAIHADAGTLARGEEILSPTIRFNENQPRWPRATLVSAMSFLQPEARTFRQMVVGVMS